MSTSPSWSPRRFSRRVGQSGGHTVLLSPADHTEFLVPVLVKLLVLCLQLLPNNFAQGRVATESSDRSKKLKSPDSSDMSSSSILGS